MYERASPFFGARRRRRARHDRTAATSRSTSAPRASRASRSAATRRTASSWRARARWASARWPSPGIRDPYTIRHVDQVIEWARGKVHERWGEAGRALPALLPRLRARWRHGRRGSRAETRRRTSSCLVVEAVAPRWEDAEVICALGTRESLLRAAAGGEGNRRDGRAHDGRGPARQGRLRVDGEPRPRHSPIPSSSPRDGASRTVGAMTHAASASSWRKTIRSKNAGVDQITFDIIFRDRGDLRAREAERCAQRARWSRALYSDLARADHRVRRVRARPRDQVHDPPRAAQRQPGRARRFRRPAVRAPLRPANSPVAGPPAGVSAIAGPPVLICL